MADAHAEDDITLPHLDLDTIAVVVFWADGADMPDVEFHNCSPFEAIGLVGQALTKLKADWRLPLAEEEDDDEPD